MCPSEEIATIQLQPIVTLKCRRFLDISIFQVKFEFLKSHFKKLEPTKIREKKSNTTKTRQNTPVGQFVISGLCTRGW